MTKEAKEVIKGDFVIKRTREKGTKAVQLELRRLTFNAAGLINEAEKHLEIYVKEENFFRANEMRVVIAIHSEYIYRLERIIDGFTAFETDDIMVYDMQPNKEQIR